MIRALVFAGGLILVVHLPVLAQSAPASPFVPQDHWSISVLRRLVLVGAVESPVVIGRRTLSRSEIAAALRDAAGAAATDESMAGRALRRFIEEFPTADPDRVNGASIHAAPTLGFERLDGRLATGTGRAAPGEPSGPPARVADHTGGTAGLAITGRFARWATVLVEGGYAGDDWRLTSAHATLALGPVLFWGGRRPIGFGPGEGGGIVLGDRATVDGGGFELARPLTGPGLLGLLGPIRFETLLARMGPSGQVEDPWFWAARGSVTPHPRLTAGINRGALFGGDGNVDATFQDLLYIIIGKHAAGGSAYENQIVSVDLHYRPPLPIPAELYVEWGFEDSSGAFHRVPGVVWGGSVSGLPGLGGARLGIEHADFARSCCGNPAWYRHMFLHAGWTEDAIPLGHPLAGHGEEWLFHGEGGLLEERLQLRASFALRDRWHENLYAPDRQGESRAATFEADYLRGRWKLTARAALESGSGWTETTLRAAVRYAP